MIEVIYVDRLGNNLFQYAFGRILASSLGFALQADPIAGFPGTRAQVSGARYETPCDILLGHFQNKTRRQKINLSEVVQNKSKRKIVVDGYFQRYEYYQPYKELIRRDWFKIGPVSQNGNTASDVVVHVRRSDMARLGIALPFSYYEEALDKAQAGRVFICTDSPKDPFLTHFKKYNPVIRSTDPMDDFKFMMSFKKIIQSASSFSWWASFLSEASEIYAPVPLNGHWSAEYPDVDLRVYDESRYRYVDCREIYQRTFTERCVQQYVSVKNKIKKRLAVCPAYS